MRRLLSIVTICFLAACSKQPDGTQSRTPSSTTLTTGTAPANATETAVAPETNPPGDIPDTQQFVKYTSAAGGYELDVPEGWARTENGSDVSFVNKIDGVRVAVTSAASAPTAATARATEAKQITAQGHAVAITSVADANLPAGKAVVIKYTSNSEPNAVTNRQIRLENEAYLYYKNGKLATLTLWAPKGADNVDQWNRMSKSFRWR